MEFSRDYIKTCIHSEIPVNIYLTNGVKLSGIITEQGDDGFKLTRDGITQLVMRQVLGTVCPAG